MRMMRDPDPLNPAILSILSTIKSKHCINLTDEKLMEQIIKTKHVSHNRTQMHNLISHRTVIAEIVVSRSSVVFYWFLKSYYGFFRFVSANPNCDATKQFLFQPNTHKAPTIFFWYHWSFELRDHQHHPQHVI